MAKKKKAPQQQGCFRCAGTGELCNICGESPAVCDCGKNDWFPCDDCEGTGRVEKLVDK